MVRAVIECLGTVVLSRRGWRRGTDWSGLESGVESGVERRARAVCGEGRDAWQTGRACVSRGEGGRAWRRRRERERERERCPCLLSIGHRVASANMCLCVCEACASACYVIANRKRLAGQYRASWGVLGRAGACCATGANRAPADKQLRGQWGALLLRRPLAARKIIMPTLAPIAGGAIAATSFPNPPAKHRVAVRYSVLASARHSREPRHALNLSTRRAHALGRSEPASPASGERAGLGRHLLRRCRLVVKVAMVRYWLGTGTCVYTVRLLLYKYLLHAAYCLLPICIDEPSLAPPYLAGTCRTLPLSLPPRSRNPQGWLTDSPPLPIRDAYSRHPSLHFTPPHSSKHPRARAVCDNEQSLCATASRRHAPSTTTPAPAPGRPDWCFHPAAPLSVFAVLPLRYEKLWLICMAWTTACCRDTVISCHLPICPSHRCPPRPDLCPADP
jgi:hypothetical protein